LDQAANLTLNLFEKKHPCQTDQGDEDGVLEDDEEAEMDAKVIDQASDVVSAMTLVIGPAFAEYFKVFLPHIKKYYVCPLAYYNQLFG
jgi:importin-4